MITTSVSKAAEYLRSGRLVAFPTETVYGLGADATNPQAVAAVFAAKNRPSFDPLIVHIADRTALASIVTAMPEAASRLADRFWPGPLTLVLPRTSRIPDLVTAGLEGVGVRIPRHPVAMELLKAAGCPVAAPSANPFGGISPTTAQHVEDSLGHAVDLVLDGGPCQVGVESTVVSFMSETPCLLRPGGCSIEEIEAVIGPVPCAVSNPNLDDAAQPAPGMLSRHYAPRTPLRLVDYNSLAIPEAGRQCGLLTEGTRKHADGFARTEILAPTSDNAACAAGFFAALRRLDAANLDVIIAHRFQPVGLGIALNDRLQRAAAEHRNDSPAGPSDNISR
ncbi:MAG: threonylcarbamoyl-AMP synthase [Planctomycetaceae bacterium]|nr:threonylcarbamoyl-AMP synthase [Planctomycetaceae bacterium]